MQEDRDNSLANYSFIGNPSIHPVGQSLPSVNFAPCFNICSLLCRVEYPPLSWFDEKPCYNDSVVVIGEGFSGFTGVLAAKKENRSLEFGQSHLSLHPGHRTLLHRHRNHAILHLRDGEERSS